LSSIVMLHIIPTNSRPGLEKLKKYFFFVALTLY
jgi:hypothetical protein